MKTQLKQGEIIIFEDENKIISMLKHEGVPRVLKRFYGHSNRNIYVTLMQNPHPNISKVFDVQNIEGGFLVEEAYLGTKTLLDYSPIMNRDEGFEILYQLCAAIKHIHQLGIVHRDLKPENIFYRNGVCYLNDFDISKDIVKKTAAQQDTQVLGSVGYASPEQYGFSFSDERTDIYSLGIIINVLFTGVLLHERLVDGTLERVVRKCTQIHADDRYQTIDELEKNLRFAQLNRSHYTLPGFRTNNRQTKFLSGIGYLLLLLIIATVENREGVTFFDHLESKVLVAGMIFLGLAIFTNYMNIKALIPRSLRNVKYIGSILLWISLMVFFLMIHMTFFAVVGSMLAAYHIV